MTAMLAVASMGLRSGLHGGGRGGLRAWPWILAGALCVLLCAAGVAHADRAQARALTEEGQRHQDAGELAAALAAYERAIAADADYRPVYELATPLWLAQGAYDTVITHFERLTRRFPDYAFAWYSLGYAYRRSERLAQAIAAYRFYVELRPGHAAGYFGLGMAYRKAGQPAEAIAALGRYVELERDPGQAAYVQEARRLITELGGTPPAPPGALELAWAALAEAPASARLHRLVRAIRNAFTPLP